MSGVGNAAHTRRSFASSVRQPYSSCSTSTAITTTSAIRNIHPAHCTCPPAPSPSAPSSLRTSSSTLLPSQVALGREAHAQSLAQISSSLSSATAKKLCHSPGHRLAHSVNIHHYTTGTATSQVTVSRSSESTTLPHASPPPHSCSPPALVTARARPHPLQPPHPRQNASQQLARQPSLCNEIPTMPYTTAFQQSTAAPIVRACIPMLTSMKMEPGPTVAGWVAAATTALLVIAPLPLTSSFDAIAPAAARIPTDVVLFDRSAAERTALQQLAVPRSAVIELSGGIGAQLSNSTHGPEEFAVQGAVQGAVQSRSAGGGGAAAASTAPSRVTGVMVGTPNYARGGGAGQLLPGPQQSIASRAEAALQLLMSARQSVDEGRHEQALELYSRMVLENPDLALAEYGRIGRAMMLYQVGRTSDSILALEDEEAVMRGAPEVHAALAALLYTERPNLVLRAEEEWDMACLFDKRYSDPEWVRQTKHWPPKMVTALRKFLSLT